MINVSNNFKNKNIIKKRNNKSFNFNDNEKNSENFCDKIEKRKYTLISLKGGYENWNNNYKYTLYIFNVSILNLNIYFNLLI